MIHCATPGEIRGSCPGISRSEGPCEYWRGVVVRRDLHAEIVDNHFDRPVVDHRVDDETTEHDLLRHAIFVHGARVPRKTGYGEQFGNLFLGDIAESIISVFDHALFRFGRIASKRLVDTHLHPIEFPLLLFGRHGEATFGDGWLAESQ